LCKFRHAKFWRSSVKCFAFDHYFFAVHSYGFGAIDNFEPTKLVLLIRVDAAAAE
jgi:hypothetical protein